MVRPTRPIRNGAVLELLVPEVVSNAATDAKGSSENGSFRNTMAYKEKHFLSNPKSNQQIRVNLILEYKV